MGKVTEGKHIVIKCNVSCTADSVSAQSLSSLTRLGAGMADGDMCRFTTSADTEWKQMQKKG